MTMFMDTMMYHSKIFCHLAVTVLSNVTAKQVLLKEQPMMIMNSPI